MKIYLHETLEGAVHTFFCMEFKYTTWNTASRNSEKQYSIELWWRAQITGYRSSLQGWKFASDKSVSRGDLSAIANSPLSIKIPKVQQFATGIHAAGSH